MEKNKKVSVIVTIYNAEKYIHQCVESILAQDYPNIEIILVNDGSSDRSSQICNEISKQNLNVITIDKENGGAFSARNKGLEAATGEYIAFVDVDDYIVPEMYSELVNLLEINSADIACCDRFRNIEFENNFSQMNREKTGVHIYTGREAVHHLFCETKFLKPAVWDKVYKREIFCGEEFPNTFFEDAGLTFRLLLKAKKVVMTEKQLYSYSVRGGSMITSPWNYRKTKSYDFVTNSAIRYLKLHDEKLVNAAVYWQLQFSVEAWERCLKSVEATKEDYTVIRNNIENSYKIINLQDLNFSLAKYIKKRLEFWMLRYIPNVLCRVKRKGIR